VESILPAKELVETSNDLCFSQLFKGNEAAHPCYPVVDELLPRRVLVTKLREHSVGLDSFKNGHILCWNV
jgi:hypothetical protein